MHHVIFVTAGSTIEKGAATTSSNPLPPGPRDTWRADEPLDHLGRRHNIAPEVLAEIRAAVLNEAATSNSEPDLRQASFGPRLRQEQRYAAGDHLARDSRQVPHVESDLPPPPVESSPTPFTWKLSGFDGVSHADGRRQLKEWLAMLDAQRKEAGLAPIRFDENPARQLTSEWFFPKEMRFDPESGSIAISGVYLPRLHWKRLAAGVRGLFAAFID